MQMDSGTKEPAVLAVQRLAQALEHPLRAQMFAELSKRKMSPPELAEVLGEPPLRVAYHYGVLEQARGSGTDTGARRKAFGAA